MTLWRRETKELKMTGSLSNMVTHLLDTNICIYIIKKSPIKVFKKLKEFEIGEIGISAITLLELQFGISKSSPPYREKNQNLLNQFLAPIEIFDYPKEASFLYGDVRVLLEKSGKKIGNLDLNLAIV